MKDSLGYAKEEDKKEAIQMKRLQALSDEKGQGLPVLSHPREVTFCWDSCLI
jgi:hypothetical protein